MTGSPDPYDVLVVGWFPAADDPIAGRFVADQVAALRAGGRIRPGVVSFENAALRGRPALRGRQEGAIDTVTGEAIAAQSPFNRIGAGGPAGVPVARLAVAAGSTPTTGADHRAFHRAAVLASLADRPDRPPWRLVHAHVGYPEGAAAALLAARLGVPLIVTEHATFVESFLAEPSVKVRYVEAVVGAHRMIAVSRMLADELEAAIPGLAGRVTVVPNAVAIDDFQPVPPARRAAAELLWVGYRKEIKGIATLLRAFRLILDARPEATLRLVGRSTSKHEEASWQRLASELGVIKSVRFEPPADRAGVVAAMSRAACFVHPSTRETFGVVAVEALAAGLPVVATNSGGVAEVLGPQPDRFGALVPASDPAALAAAVIRTLDRRASFDPFELHDYAERRFGAAAVAGQLADLYDEVLEKVEPAAGGVRRRTRKTPGRAADDGGPEPARPARIILAAFVRTELDRALERFPAEVLAGVEIVTAGPPLPARPGVSRAPAGTDERLAALLEWGAPRATPVRRLIRRLRRGGRSILDRLGRGSGADDALVASLGRTLEAAVGPIGSDPPLVVCLSGIDYLAAAPLIAAGRLLPSPGGLRWLADLRTSLPPQPAADSVAREV